MKGYFYSSNRRLFCDLYKGGDKGVVLSHGLEGSKDGRKWLALYERLSARGFSVLKFNYSGCGYDEVSDGDFEDTTLSLRIGDFRNAIRFFKGETGCRRIGVVGSSFGGMVAIASGEDINALVLIATPLSLNVEGEVVLPSGRRLKGSFSEDLKNYDLEEAARGIKAPTLIIHGEKDELVPLSEAQKLYEAINSEKELHIIKGGDHILDSHIEELSGMVLNWFEKHL